MSVADIFEERAAFSFEVFPPKTDVGMEKLCGAGGVLEQLYTLNPDYISCTYGAGGTNVGKNLEVLDKIQKDGKCTPVTHFTCIGNTREGIKEQLQTYLDHGIDHMLALRGDLPFGWKGTGGDLHYATSDHLLLAKACKFGPPDPAPPAPRAPQHATWPAHPRRGPLSHSLSKPGVN